MHTSSNQLQFLGLSTNQTLEVEAMLCTPLLLSKKPIPSHYTGLVMGNPTTGLLIIPIGGSNLYHTYIMYPINWSQQSIWFHSIGKTMQPAPLLCYPGAAPLRVALKCLSSFVTLKQHHPTRRVQAKEHMSHIFCSSSLLRIKKGNVIVQILFIFSFLSWQPPLQSYNQPKLRTNHNKPTTEKNDLKSSKGLGTFFLLSILLFDRLWAHPIWRVCQVRIKSTKFDECFIRQCHVNALDGSMGRFCLFTDPWIRLMFMVNVGKYIIHGSYRMESLHWTIGQFPDLVLQKFLRHLKSENDYSPNEPSWHQIENRFRNHGKRCLKFPENVGWSASFWSHRPTFRAWNNWHGFGTRSDRLRVISGHTLALWPLATYNTQKVDGTTTSIKTKPPWLKPNMMVYSFHALASLWQYLLKAHTKQPLPNCTPTWSWTSNTPATTDHSNSKLPSHDFDWCTGRHGRHLGRLLDEFHVEEDNIYKLHWELLILSDSLMLRVFSKLMRINPKNKFTAI